MKRFNHDRILRAIYATERIDATDGHGIALHALEEIVETIADCGCVQACAQLLPVFHLALCYARLGDWKHAGAFLTEACKQIHLLEIANASQN